MPVIGLVDDDAKMRAEVEKLIVGELEGMPGGEDWSVLQSPPLASLLDYPGWQTDNDIAVLVIDERLNEKLSTPYAGHDVVHHIQPRDYQLPVYYLTAVASDDDVQKDFARVRGIIDRRSFMRAPHRWVREFVEEGLRYKERVQQQLARLSELSLRALEPDVSEDELEEAASIRAHLQLPFDSLLRAEQSTTRDRSVALVSFAEELTVLDRLVSQLEEVTGEAGSDRRGPASRRARIEDDRVGTAKGHDKMPTSAPPPKPERSSKSTGARKSAARKAPATKGTKTKAKQPAKRPKDGR